MFQICRPRGRLFDWVLTERFAHMAAAPGRTAMLFLQNALSTADAIAGREIIDPEQLRNGISKIIDGPLPCLNASSWCKQLPAAASQPAKRQEASRSLRPNSPASSLPRP